MNAFWHFFEKPVAGGVYNMGGSRHSNRSMVEPIDLVEERVGQKIQYSLSGLARSEDHIWYVRDVRRFQSDYPEWRYEYDLNRILDEMIEATRERAKSA